MDFQELLNHADYNIAESKYTGASQKYSCELPPPKKVPKASVQSESIRRFLEKKKQEEEAKAEEARRQKEKLLALRAQNSKNNKKAKIMASRTKDNDFSKIKLTDDELEAKKKREAELIKKNLADKVERMKARIEMEEKEKLMPKKRKRKSKNAEPCENVDDNHDNVDLQNSYKDLNIDAKHSTNSGLPKNIVRKPRPPPVPTPSFTELLKIAEKKQYEPVEIPVVKKEEEKLMTKKERKLREEELARERRKQERLMQAESGRSLKPSSLQSSSINKNTSEKVVNNKPVVIHVNKDISKADRDGKFKIPKSSTPVLSNKNISTKNITNLNSKNIPNTISSEKPSKTSLMNEQKKISKLKSENSNIIKDMEIKQKGSMPKKNGLKINSVQTAPEKPTFDEAALRAELEKKIKEQLEKEMEEKIAAKFAQLQNLQSNKAATEKPVETPKLLKKEPGIGTNMIKKPIERPNTNNRKEIDRMVSVKKQSLQQKSLKPKLPEKKPFHFNPYLDPPRRLLEPQRPPRPPMKRRLESDDEEDEDDDDDMRDFIDDSPSQNEENYSEYIKEIFKYDKSRYVDDDDDDVMESSFAEQMKEEVRSARLGYLEDLEEEKLELERLKRKKLKNK